MRQFTYRLDISYRGAAYAGWQRQENALAVQQVLEEALERVLGVDVRTPGAGRTDAGVHARGQVAHLRLAEAVPMSQLVQGTNRLLPDDIRVLGAARMHPGFDARKCAQGKEYHYHLIRTRVLSPLDSDQAVVVFTALDIDRMQRATKLLVGRHDWSAFARSGGSHRQPFRKVREAEWSELPAGRLRLRIVGDGFLRGMVRAIVGTVLEVGRGVRSVDSVAGLLSGGQRADAGPSAPAHGLVLVRVFYDPKWGPLEGAGGNEMPESA